MEPGGGVEGTRSTNLRVRLAALLAVAVLGIGIGIGTARAEEESPQGSEPAAAPVVAVPADDFDRGSPRSAVLGFLVACRAGDYQRAANYLSLGSARRGKRGTSGPALARKLKTVLDRKLWVEVDRLSDDPAGHTDDGLPANRDLVGTIDRSTGRADIAVDRVPRGDGVQIWKFSPQTVREIPSLYDEFGYGRLGAWLPPLFFESHFLEIQLWQWLGLIAVVFAAFLASWLVAGGIVALARPMVAKSSSDLDDRVLHAVVGPLRVLIGALLFYVALPLLALSIPAQNFFTNAAKVGALL
jgi:MscS family membrane protein